jgi:hypothetical protein
MNAMLKIEMYDNENRNLRIEREKLLEHIRQLERDNQNQEKALSFLSTQKNETLLPIKLSGGNGVSTPVIGGGTRIVPRL